jgi:inorganic triphosphatase YgiF
MTLDELPQHPPGVLDALPIDILANLKEQADAHLASASQMVAILHGVFERRYAAGLNSTGTHHRQDGGFDIKVTIPKRVDWDQAKLDAAVKTIREEWQADPAEYVDFKVSVQERRYDAWPSAIRDLFEPARTVKTGKPQFAVTLAKREAA